MIARPSEELEKYISFLGKHFDQIIVIGLIGFAIISILMFSQVRGVGPIKFSLAINKFLYLTAIGKFLLFLSYAIMLFLITLILFRVAAHSP